jgi:hypothetical protein
MTHHGRGATSPDWVNAAGRYGRMVSFEGLGSDLAASARSIALCNGGGVQMRLTGATETANWEVIGGGSPRLTT